MTVTPHVRYTLGGSEIAAACGIDPYCSALELSARKLGRIPPPPETEAMRMGKLLQTFIAELTPDLMPAPDETLTDPERAWCVGRPDGYLPEHGVRVVAEIKATHGYGWPRDGVPLHYQAQGQWYCHLTGLPAVTFIVLRGLHLQRWTYERDERAIDYLLTAGEAFVRLLRRGRLAEADRSDSARATVLQLFPASVPAKVYRLSRDEWALVRELRARREQLAAIEAQVQELESRLKLAMGDAETAISPHDTAALHWRTVQARRMDTAALRAERPEIAAQYEKVTTTRRFTLA